MPLIPALGRQRQVDLCEFEVNLVCRVSSRTIRAVTPVLKNQKEKKKVQPKPQLNSEFQTSLDYIIK